GGIDSTACASFLLAQSYAVDGLFIDYGQAAAEREHQAVEAISRHLGISLQVVGSTSDTGFSTGELTGRNAFFIFAALLFTRGRSGMIALGIHAGTQYYDCSEPFLKSISTVVSELTNGCVSVFAPFLTWSKRDVHDYFVSSRLPLDLTYSCEAGLPDTCG